VQIAVHSTGICGSDVSYFTKGYIGDFVVKDPMVLGHESAGTVCKLGPGVTNLEVGKLRNSGRVVPDSCYFSVEVNMMVITLV